VTVGIPPPSRNQRTPTGSDTPASSAASVELNPSAIANQNTTRSPRAAIPGRPGDRNGSRPVNSFIHPAGLPITRLLDQALRRPVEFAQYVSLGFGQLCAKTGISRSMGSTGVCWDNAVAETFFATLKKELVYRRSWPTRNELISEIFEFIEAFYNRTRRHSTLGMLSPVEFEEGPRRSAVSDPR
jgi:transposase InsO family protein